MYRLPIVELLKTRIVEPRRFIQVLHGPRQTGKTTAAMQVISDLSIPVHFATADAPEVKSRGWLVQQWDTCRAKIRTSGGTALLVIDEIQKIPNWSEEVKASWDSDTRNGIDLKVLILGSSPLLILSGLTESLAGRFEIIRMTHWGLSQMREAFGWDLDRFVYFGGYPGAVALTEDRDRWVAYIKDSLIETTISRDILLMTRVDKPALLRQLFNLGCEYSAQILSYQKMTGQLQDAGNTVTLANYLSLLEGAGMIAGLQKFSGSRVMQRSSSPKLLVLNSALKSALSDLDFKQALSAPEYWGRMVETAVGAHLFNGLVGTGAKVLYWREGNNEMDYVVTVNDVVTAIEVKSGRPRGVASGVEAFRKRYPDTRFLLVGQGGIPITEFLSKPAREWVW
ncbi:MAG: AAA family ATPase [Myxococcota bacterium]|jgi:hypothetical protein